jgi:hypothetical protein
MIKLDEIRRKLTEKYLQLPAIPAALSDRGCVKTQNTSIDLDLKRVHGF